MNLSKLSNSIVEFAPKKLEIIKEGMQVRHLDDTALNNFRTGVKIGNNVAYSLDGIYELVSGVKVQDLNFGPNTPGKVINYIA